MQKHLPSNQPEIGVSGLVADAVEAIEASTCAQALYAYVGALCRQVGFDYFSYFVSDPLQFGDRPPADPMCSTSYPEAWRQRYSSQGYQHHDPLLRAGGTMRRPFTWGDEAYVSRLSGKARQMFDDARAFGIRGGVTMPVYGPGGDSSLLSVSGRAVGAPFDDLVHESAPLLHVVAHRMHAVMIERLLPQSAGTDILLTEQERACLLWTLRGKTAWEIAQIIGRSRATVNFHLQKSLRKLGASNKSHAAVKALRAGLI